MEMIDINKPINIISNNVYKFKVIFSIFLFSMLIPHHPYFVISILFSYSSADAFVEYVLPYLFPEIKFDPKNIESKLMAFIFALTFFSYCFIFKAGIIISIILSICMTCTVKELGKIYIL